MSKKPAVIIFECVRTAPRGIPATAAVEIIAKGSSLRTSARATPGDLYRSPKGIKPSAEPGPIRARTWIPSISLASSWGRCPSPTISIVGSANANTTFTSSADNRQLMGYATAPILAQAPKSSKYSIEFWAKMQIRSPLPIPFPVRPADNWSTRARNCWQVRVLSVPITAGSEPALEALY